MKGPATRVVGRSGLERGMKCAATRCGEARRRRTQFLLRIRSILPLCSPLFPNFPSSYPLPSFFLSLPHPKRLLLRSLLLLLLPPPFFLLFFRLWRVSLFHAPGVSLSFHPSVSVSLCFTPRDSNHRGPVECRLVYRTVHLVARSFRSCVTFK